MKLTYIGPQDIKIADIQLPKDIEERKTAPHIQATVHSLKVTGLIQRVVIRKSDKKLICGADRLAAHILSGQETVRAEVYEVDDLGLKYLQETENAVRRHSTKEKKSSFAAMVKLEARVIAEADKADEPPKLKEKKATDKAIRQVASRTGVKPGTVERNVRRETNEPKPTTALAKPGLPEGFASCGIPLTDDFVADVAQYYAETIGLDRLLRDAQAAITEMLKDSHIPSARLERWKESLHDLAAEVRSQRPAGFCPYCKGVAGLSEACPICGGCQIVTAQHIKETPKQLLDETAPHVFRNGAIVPLDIAETSIEEDADAIDVEAIEGYEDETPFPEDDFLDLIGPDEGEA